jgi:hypothetical protein
MSVKEKHSENPMVCLMFPKALENLDACQLCRVLHAICIMKGINSVAHGI